MMNMGTSYIADCNCGYSDIVFTGSTRREHGHKFFYPHACNACSRIVSVDVLSTSKTCPKCGSDKVTLQGVMIPDPPPSRFEYGSFLDDVQRLLSWALQLLTGARKPAKVLWEDESYCFRTSATYALAKGAHECPKCRAQSLRFSLSSKVD